MTNQPYIIWNVNGKEYKLRLTTFNSIQVEKQLGMGMTESLNHLMDPTVVVTLLWGLCSRTTTVPTYARYAICTTTTWQVAVVQKKLLTLSLPCWHRSALEIRTTKKTRTVRWRKTLSEHNGNGARCKR